MLHYTYIASLFFPPKLTGLHVAKILSDTRSHVALLVAVCSFMEILFITIQKLSSVLPYWKFHYV